ncbi:MAG TPA: DUF1801 domain-containing protein [Aeromicrobium sp.]|nr:DUF1801 domain-containing protein [Aeromicrobium sp.]
MAKILTIGEYVESMSETLRPVGEKLTQVLDGSLPEADGFIWHGHPVWMVGDSPIAAFKAHSAHVTFMIWKGQLLTDRSGLLQPAGSSEMANLKVSSVDEVDENVFANWLHQAQDLELP